jgi:predicted nucleic acid-binding protein
VILSTLIGGKAAEDFVAAIDIEFITTSNIIAEVREYIPSLSRKKGLDDKAMEAVLSLLPIRVYPRGLYVGKRPTALGLIGERDPDDVELLALALAFDCPIWSNDNDLKDVAEAKVFTTAVMLRRLDAGRSREI